MDKKKLEELYTLKLDGCLSAEEEREYAIYLQEHPEVSAELEAFEKVRADLRAVVPASQEPPYPDFFNSHLERMVRESTEAPSNPVVKKSVFTTFGAWLLPASAAAILAFFAGMQIGPSTPAGTTASTSSAGVLPAVYSPLTTVHAEATVDIGLGSPIITLDGLEDLPDSVDFLQTAGRESDKGIYLVSTKMTF